MQKISSLLFAVVILFSCVSPHGNECEVLKEGTFRYLDDIGDPSSAFVIRNETHMEYHEHMHYEIESLMVWKNDCEYELEMVRTNYEDFPFKTGDKIRITIDKVNGDTIYYTAKASDGSNWTSRVLKVGD